MSLATFTVHLARTGEHKHVAARDWQTALKATGRPDACLLAERVDLLGNSDPAIDATFAPDSPTVITTRCREGTIADRMAFALACVANHLDTQATGEGAA
ncbi:hypothetical protein [Franzmannia qiaohouensis]|uniref:Uncharacterized protein n=1 Tax=Franzmannia qiaohouensis TaxID=1329370 RepID=A0ABU1H970_9GAMM|nr:hypothetical protein [Halomonas qiaohouensis]MDR5904007.1 hypothetical protein [Halomonas qiaohouensis]